MIVKSLRVVILGLIIVSCGEYELKKVGKCDEGKCDEEIYSAGGGSPTNSYTVQTPSCSINIAEPESGKDASDQDTYGLMKGGIVGNGGDVLVCETAAVETIEVFDIYEARTLRQLTLDLGVDGTVNEKVELALRRLERLDSERAQRYLKQADTFFAEANILPIDFELPDVTDTNEIGKPNNCSLKQIAIQRSPIGPQDKRYHIADKWWSRLNDDNKAALVLHEIIYREALTLGHQDSTAVRVLVGHIISAEFKSMSQNDYNLMMKDAKLPPVKTLEKMRIYIGSETYDESGKHLLDAILAEDLEVSEGLIFAAGSRIYFHPNGRIKEGTLAQDFVYESSECKPIKAGTAMTFDKEGNNLMRNGATVGAK